MGKEKVSGIEWEKIEKLRRNYPAELFQTLARIEKGKKPVSIYLVGGTVRDCLLEIPSHDLDLAVVDGAIECAKLLIQEMGYGTFVDLCSAEEEAGRVVLKGVQVDIAVFRAKTTDIEDDLRLRDFTINAMALQLSNIVDRSSENELIDPTGGIQDLLVGLVKHCPGAFVADPVRMLRGYRLCALYGFTMDADTVRAVRAHRVLIHQVAAERISYELQLIFDSPRTTVTVKAMAETGLLRELLPELYEGEGLEQPEFHHLDVLNHSFQALAMMEEIIADPAKYFSGKEERIGNYLKNENRARCLKWAALMHDVGKPVTRKEPADENGRVTFYRHDEEGRTIFNMFADSMRWSKTDKEISGGLIAMHMHPFHLCNVQHKKEITKRAALKLCRRAKDDLVGLFMLAMSDSLASKGEKKPEMMEGELVQLFDSVMEMYDENIQPVIHGPRIVTGRDLIDEFGLSPGPLFSVLLDELEVARVEGNVIDRDSGLSWVRTYLQKEKQIDTDDNMCS